MRPSNGWFPGFMVFRAKDSKTRESLPIQLGTKEAVGVALEAGRSYTAAMADDLPK